MFEDADFEALRANQTARFPIEELFIRGNPKFVVLLVQWAGEGNERWMAGARNAKLKTLSEEDARLFYDELAAKTVIVGWENVLDAEGKPLAYTPERGLELLIKLRGVKRSHIVNRITIFAANAENFTAPPVNAGALGNS